MLNSGSWKRVSKSRMCPVCEKPDWCLVAGPAHDPTAAICARIESDKRAGEAGWLHRLRNDRAWRAPRRRTVRVSALARAIRPDLSELANRCASAIRPDELGRLADSLGLSVASLRRLRVGWSAEHRAYTFPMTNSSGIVLGIRLRLLSGSKLAIRGSKEGLFIPDDLQHGGRLLICEGPTDTTALLDLQFAAVGRPSCAGGINYLAEFTAQQDIDEAVIMADGDGPGRRGAESLAAVLVAYATAVRIIEPPDGMNDARAWKQAGATKADVEVVIAAATVRNLTIEARMTRR